MSASDSLIVELRVEELPPKALQRLGEALRKGIADGLAQQGLLAEGAVATGYASPRRLAVHLSGVLERAADRAQSQKLMPVSVGIDARGEPTAALLKKLQALGLGAEAVAGLRRAPDGKADALFLDSTLPGATLDAGLQKALDAALAALPIPKVMSYQLHARCELPGWSSVSFVRPAHGLLALHGRRVVPVQALGLAASDQTEGHRFEAARTPIRIPHADDYAAMLEREGAVIPGFAARRAEIERQIAAACAALGGGMRPVQDEALLDEVTALVERPNVLVCAFEPEFLQVPQECLILTMKANQKYFPLLDAQGRLTHRFLVVSNVRPADPSAVVAGNERVVRPRLADAKFFFDQDRRHPLASRLPALDKVVYHNQLGSQGVRSARVQAIARAIVAELGLAGTPEGDAALSAARLAKADLLTDMVGEFPELQGVMGGYYARHDGLGDTVAGAIEDHYRPRYAGDQLPRDLAGVVVALADKMETLAGLFGIGSLPTGDKDPFALRRHALGVVRMLVERDLPLAPAGLVAIARSAFDGIALQDNAPALEEFMRERLRGYLRDEGYSPAEVDAAVHAHRLERWNSLPRRLEAVRAFAQLPEALALAAANKRIGNILKKVSAVDPHVSPVLLQEEAERELHAVMLRVLPLADAHFEAGDYSASLRALAALRGPVDAFFDRVMVNVEQLDLRLNRLGLLQGLHDAMNRVADLSRLAA